MPASRPSSAACWRTCPPRSSPPSEIGLDLDVDEPYDTYAENATAKADAYARASGLLSLADDSGIEVAALDWGPGVRSARWGGGANADRLLEAVGDAADRRARMVCALAVGSPGTPEPRRDLHRRRRGIGRAERARSRRLRIRPGLPAAERRDDRGAARAAKRTGSAIADRAVAAATPRLLELLADR